jgi:hypothetical protein
MRPADESAELGQLDAACENLKKSCSSDISTTRNEHNVSAPASDYYWNNLTTRSS